MQSQNKRQQGFDCLGSAAGHVVEIQAAFNNNGGLTRLAPGETAMLCAELDVHATGRGQVLMSCDEPNLSVLILLSGKARVVEFDQFGNCTNEQTLVPGAVLGSVAERKEGRVRVHCISTEPVDFLILTTETLGSLALKKPILAIRLLQALVDGSSNTKAAPAPAGAAANAQVQAHARTPAPSSRAAESAENAYLSYH